MTQADPPGDSFLIGLPVGVGVGFTILMLTITLCCCRRRPAAQAMRS
jgi:hypothetical protein